MKKISLCLIALSMLFFLNLKREKNPVSPHSLGKQIWDHIEERKSTKPLLDKAIELYKNEPDKFLEVITAHDADGWTLLLHTAVHGGTIGNNVNHMIDALVEYFGDDYKTIATIMNFQDRFGNTPLYMAVLRNHEEAVNTLLDRAYEIFGHDKDLMLSFLRGENFKTHKREENNAWTPLILAADSSKVEIARDLLEKAHKFFANDPSYFKAYIDTKDVNGTSAFYYAGFIVKGLLCNYGATHEAGECSEERGLIKRESERALRRKIARGLVPAHEAK